MAEYIEGEALYEKAYWHGEHPDVGNPFPDGVDAIDIKDVDAIPAADVVPVRHGNWGSYEPNLDGYRCSCCKLVHRTCTTYCPNCGATMKLED